MNKKTDHSFEFDFSRQFASWLVEVNASIAFTTYQTGKMFFIGMGAEDRIGLFERTFARCMGLTWHDDGLYMSSLYQLWRFENALPAGRLHKHYDRMYVPQYAWTTGDIDMHDIGIDQQGKPVFVNTLFSCLAQASEKYSFTPIWKPAFISKMAAEDRCHLNGLAMHNGKPTYVTAVAQTDVNEGWRDHRRDGGIVIDVASNEIVAQGLSMPHSPRLYQNKLWLLDSGSGYFGYIDINSGKLERVCFCPGYLRGLNFIGDYAIMGLSTSRGKTFSGLSLDDHLQSKRAKPRCGLSVVDLRSGDIVHSVRITGIIEELYDVVVLPDVKSPMALGFKTDEIRRTITTPPDYSL